MKSPKYISVLGASGTGNAGNSELAEVDDVACTRIAWNPESTDRLGCGAATYTAEQEIRNPLASLTAWLRVSNAMIYATTPERGRARL